MLVVTDSVEVARACAPIFAAVPYVVPELPSSRRDLEAELLLERAVISAVQAGLCSPGREVVLIQVSGWQGRKAFQSCLQVRKRMTAQPFCPWTGQALTSH